MDPLSLTTPITLKNSLTCTPLEDVHVRLPIQSVQYSYFTILGDGCTFSTDGLNYVSKLELEVGRGPAAEAQEVLSFYIRPVKPSVRELNFEVHASANILDGQMEIARVPRVKLLSAPSGTVSTQLRLPDPTVIVYTTAGPIGPESLPLRSEMIARHLVHCGETVLYAPTAKVQNPGRVDLGGSGTLFQLGQAEFLDNIDNILGKTAPGLFICSSKSDSSSLRAMGLAKLQGWKTIYEVRDDLEAMRQMGFAKFYDPSIELAICRLVDEIIVVSEPLKHKFRAWGICEKKISVIPNGVLDSELSTFLNPAEPPREKRAVYFGHLFPGRFDYSQVQQLARSYPSYEFRLYGPGYDPKNGSFPDNVGIFGQVTAEQFFSKEADAEIGLLPFRANAMTFSLSPLKLAQYYALKLKVVSSDIFQIRNAPLVFSDSNTSLTANFQNAVDYDITAKDLEQVKDYMTKNNWANVVTKTLEIAGR